MNTKISAIILTMDEGNTLKDCIKNIQPHSNEIIIIDSSQNTLDSIIAKDLKCKYYHREIGKNNINGFDDLRNFGNASSSNDWVLHIDVDEIFPDIFFNKIDSIITEQKSNAYAFPRINLPFYELYPDYQTRLINRLKAEWTDHVHEKVDIFTDPAEIICLDNYPIIHKPKNQNDKIKVNKRWSSLNIKRNILICSLFKNSEKFMDRFLNNLLNLINYSKTNHNIECNTELCFIEGNSIDNTHEKLKKWLTDLPDNINYKFKQLNLSTNIDRFTSLAILRNMLIKTGLKSYHDYILMIDSDTIFDKDILVSLVNSIEKNQCDVIAPLPFIEDYKEYKNTYFYDTLAFVDNNDINFNHFYPYSQELKMKNIIKMTSVGTCYLMKADVYNINDFSNFNITKCYRESQSKPLISYEGINNEDNKPISEQVALFKIIKKKGYQTYVDSNIKILHVNLEKIGEKWH